jgi:hypothetical protein
MPEPLPIMVGYLLWFVFVIVWNVTDRRTPIMSTAGAQRERLFTLRSTNVKRLKGPMLLPRMTRRPESGHDA